MITNEEKISYENGLRKRGVTFDSDNVTSYFTGYTDLDKKLLSLYDSQTALERLNLPTNFVISKQNMLLDFGRFRRENKVLIE